MIYVLFIYALSFEAHHADSEVIDICCHSWHSPFCCPTIGQDRVQEEGGGEDGEQAEGAGDAGEDGQQGLHITLVSRSGGQGNTIWRRGARKKVRNIKVFLHLKICDTIWETRY